MGQRAHQLMDDGERPVGRVSPAKAGEIIKTHTNNVTTIVGITCNTPVNNFLFILNSPQSLLNCQETSYNVCL